MTENKITGAAKDEDLSGLRINATATPSVLELAELFLANNVRDVSEYNLAPLIESMRKNGYRSQHPVVIHVGSDGKNEVLAGNRRTNALRTFSPTELKEILAGSSGKVPCVVYRGLTPAQVEILRCDHGTDEDREPLSKYGLFVATGRLLIAGLTETAIAHRLGIFVVKEGVKSPNRSAIQVFAAAARLPARVKEMLKQYWIHGTGTIRQSDIMPLQKIWNEEFTQHGIFNKEVPRFRAKVAEIEGRAEGAKVETTKTLTVNGATDKAKIAQSPVTRQLLMAAVQNDPSALNALDTELAARDKLISQVNWLMEHKNKVIVKLLQEAAEALAKEEAETLEAARKAEAEKTTQPTV